MPLNETYRDISLVETNPTKRRAAEMLGQRAIEQATQQAQERNDKGDVPTYLGDISVANA